MEIRPWQCGDEILAVAAERHLSTTSLAYRFLTGTGGRLPKEYLRHIAAGPGPTWDAQVAVGPAHLIGWAEFGRLPGRPEEADLAVIVADPWQRRGIATALVRAMLPRCLAAGVRQLHADVSPTNRAARGLLQSLFSPALSAAYVDGVVHYELSLAAALREAEIDTLALSCC
jgi:GNAT superfamily N-acetyltransferase